MSDRKLDERRVVYLECLLSYPDVGRFYSLERLEELRNELEELRQRLPEVVPDDRTHTYIEQLLCELKFKQRQLDSYCDELSELKLKVRDLHELLKKMVEAYRDTSPVAVYQQRLAKSMADAMDRMDDIVLRPVKRPVPQNDADEIVSMVNECAMHGAAGLNL